MLVVFKSRVAVTAIFAVSLMLCGPVSAQEIEFASSPNPVGSGARALGMGGGVHRCCR